MNKTVAIIFLLFILTSFNDRQHFYLKNIHGVVLDYDTKLPIMEAYISTRDESKKWTSDSYFTLTDSMGNFELKNIKEDSIYLIIGVISGFRYFHTEVKTIHLSNDKEQFIDTLYLVKMKGYNPPGATCGNSFIVLPSNYERTILQSPNYKMVLKKSERIMDTLYFTKDSTSILFKTKRDRYVIDNLPTFNITPNPH